MSTLERVLIVNADDYGLTVGVARAILDAHRRGIVTSTSALVLGPGWASSSAWLADHPALGVGAHLAVVGEDPPLLSSREIPTLVDRRGRLHLSWRQFLPRAAAHRIDPDDLRREFGAQLDALAALGLPLTHIDSHQNLHLWPSVRSVMVELAVERGIGAVRVTRSMARSPVGVVVRRLARSLESAARRAQLRYPAASTGLDEAGHLVSATMVAAIERLGASGAVSAELATHPGEGGDPSLARYEWGYEWGEEAAALVAPEVRSSVDRAGFTLGTFADLGEQTDRPAPS